MPMLSPQSVHQSQPKTLIHPHEQCLAAYEQWSRVMEYITLHWKASSQLKSLASKPAADPNLLRLLSSAVNRPSNEGEGDQALHHSGNRDVLNLRIISSDINNRTVVPWMPEDKVYSPSLMGLHEEMEDFYHYMAPFQEEKYMRNEIVNRLRQVVSSLWANAEVKVYGSFETGLYLPTSDIDVVIKCPDLEPLTALTLLEQSLIKQGDCDDVKVIRTSVPIVKFTDKSTATKVDVSINIEGALSSAEFIKEMIATYPELKYLGFVLKQFLTSRGLLESFNGGISSYCLILLIVSYLQLHPEDRSSNNHGIRLIKFLELYGRHFNYLNCGIRVTDGGSYFRKGENNMGDKFSLLCVEDPFNADNDVGQSCFGAMKVREEFDRAFRELCDGVLPQYSHLQPHSTSLLGRILSIAPEVVAYRRFVYERYHHLCQPPPVAGAFFLPSPGLRSYMGAQVQQSMNHFNPSYPPNHHQFATPSYQTGQGQQQLNYSHQQLQPSPVTPLLFQHHQLPFMTTDGLQQSTYRYSQYQLPGYLLSNVITQSLPADGIYPNQMPPLQIQAPYAEDKSDSDSLSSQHSTQSSQISQGPGNITTGSNKVSNESEQDQEVSSIKSLNSLLLHEPIPSTTILSETMTTSTSIYSHQHTSTAIATVTSNAVMTSNYSVNKSPKGSSNSSHSSTENSNRSSSSNSLDTLCEITNSRHSQSIKSNYHHHHHHHHDRYHQSNRSSGYQEEHGNRSQFVQRVNSTKHNSNSKTFPPTVYFSRSSPPLDSSRSSHQSRQGSNRSGTNHRDQINVITSSASPVTSSHFTESSLGSRSKNSNAISSQSASLHQQHTTSVVNSLPTSNQQNQQYHRCAHPSKSSRKSNTYPPSSSNFSRSSFKNQKISPSSSSSSSSSCSPTYSPAVIAVSAISR